MKDLLLLVGYCLLSLPLAAQTGTPTDPFTSLAAALNVSAEGVYHFDLSGQTFSTLVDENGYVQVLLEYGSWNGALPQTANLDGSSSGALVPAALATLTEARELRMSSSSNSLDAVTPDSTMIQRVVTNTTLFNGKQDNAYNDAWVGTGAQYLTADAGQNQSARPLHQEVYHVYAATGTGGMHWYPWRGDQALLFNQQVPDDEIWTVWVRAARSCSIGIGGVGTTPPGCPDASDGTLTVTAACGDCVDGLEYSLDNTAFQASNQFSGLAAGDYTVYVRAAGAELSCSDSTAVTVAPGVDTTPPDVQPLPTLIVRACNGPVQVVPPTVPDNCAGTITGTTTDPTTFSATGNYTIVWTFADGNGNTAELTEAVEVYASLVSLPFTENLESGGASTGCWRVTDFNGDGQSWAVAEANALAYEGRYVFYLPPSAVGQTDRLRSPAFSATTDRLYRLRFAYRPLQAGGQEGLNVHLMDFANDSVVRTIFVDIESQNVYREIDLAFAVPSSGDYRIVFDSYTPASSNGLLLDDIRVTEDTGLPSGAADLAGDADNNCTSSTRYGVFGFATTRFHGPDGRLMLEIDPNGNDLGDVSVQMTDYSEPPLSPASGQYHFSRHFNIHPSTGSGPFTNNGGVKVRLYFPDTELIELNDLTGSKLEWQDLALTHYSGPNEDCDIFNSTGGETYVEATELITAFGGTAHALSFTTTSFSEFGAANSVAFPVDLRAFTAAEQGEHNRLDWWVDSEIDFSHYAVERSADGLVFTALARVEGAHQPQYSWIDPAPAALQYYRLKLEDYDGSYAYSDVVSVQRSRGADNFLTAYPTPASGPLTVRFHAAADRPVRLHVTDVLGRTVYSRELHAQAGLNEHVLELGHLPPATYQVTLQDGERQLTTRVVRQ